MLLPARPLNTLALIAGAERLRRAAASATGLPLLLRGRRFALLSDNHDSPAAAAFVRAATELGGHVARVRASGPGDRPPHDLAALLGQLYDAIECQGLPKADLLELGRHAGVPVFDGIGDAAHPLHRLADTMTGDDAAVNRHRLLQSLLTSSLG
ncbi:MAG: ornithine carbamoyltransferase [Rubrivivax sp.]|nr:MAG: ornithine carbamoyltransferase [Rubrivivax sp.]